jgi:hypothetical protein
VPEGAKIAVDDKKAYPDEKTAYPVEKKAYPSEKKGDDKITPVAAPIIVADTSYVEEEYAPQEPEYMRVRYVGPMMVEYGIPSQASDVAQWAARRLYSG